jgi:hypothetical protein
VRASFNRFDRINELDLLGPGYDYPALDYVSLDFGLAYRLGSE